MFGCHHFYCGGVLGGEPPQAGRLARICSVPFLLYGISRLMPLNDVGVRLVLIWLIVINCHVRHNCLSLRGATATWQSRGSGNGCLGDRRARNYCGQAGCRVCVVCRFYRRGDFSAVSYRGAQSLRGHLLWGSRVRLFSFLLRGISRLTLEMIIVSDWLYNVARNKPSRHQGGRL